MHGYSGAIWQEIGMWNETMTKAQDDLADFTRPLEADERRQGAWSKGEQSFVECNPGWERYRPLPTIHVILQGGISITSLAYIKQSLHFRLP